MELQVVAVDNDDPNTSHAVEFDTFDNPLSFGLYYEETPIIAFFNPLSGIVTAISNEDVNIDLAVEGLDSSDLSESIDSDVFSGFLSETVTVYDASNGTNLVSLDDFVGDGDVTALFAGMSLPFSGNFVLDNVSEAATWVDAALDGWIEVQYVIPESRHLGAALALAALALLLVRRRRRL